MFNIHANCVAIRFQGRNRDINWSHQSLRVCNAVALVNGIGTLTLFWPDCCKYEDVSSGCMKFCEKNFYASTHYPGSNFTDCVKEHPGLLYCVIQPGNWAAAFTLRCPSAANTWHLFIVRIASLVNRDERNSQAVTFVATTICCYNSIQESQYSVLKFGPALESSTQYQSPRINEL